MTTPLYKVAEKLCLATADALRAGKLEHVVYLTYLYDSDTGEGRLSSNLAAEDLMRFTVEAQAHILEQFEGIKAAIDAARKAAAT